VRSQAVIFLLPYNGVRVYCSSSRCIKSRFSSLCGTGW
jgi:hypothetical protein